ncbi:MAG TPA: hypothetical protein VGD58_22965 [Herpetosiphonaceae bacterium]
MKSARACALMLCLLVATLTPNMALKPSTPESLHALWGTSITIMDDTSNGAGGGGHTGG